MRLQIRTRLALVSAALMAAVLLALGAFLYLRLQADLREASTEALGSRIGALADRLHDELPTAPVAEPEDAFAQILSLEGEVLAFSAGLPTTPLIPIEELEHFVVPGSRHRYEQDVRVSGETLPARLLTERTEDRYLIVGAAIDDERDTLNRLLILLGIGGPVAIALAGAAGWVVAGAAMRPVERIRLEAEAVSASEPGRRLPVPQTSDELARLGESLNGMLARLEAALERERRFVGDAGHELRTPLANLRAELELALRRSRTPEELESAIRSAAEETERLSRLAEDLLVLARADGGRLPVRREDLDVAEIVDATVASFAGRARERGVALEASLGDPGRASVDPARLRQAVGNLVDNALRHTPRGGRVTVGVGRPDGSLEIEVADTGEGFPAGFLDRAFEPFARADRARGRSEGGTGLGLAIVRAVAEAHGGSVEAANRPGSGAVVTLRLPAS